ncbi:uncharacterized protein LOC143710319 [Siphateles boraxobius]|uniref:uncharacterized protein LOC143710319 n=1 Tax=Siphateles boraxobius TaxID=180520 RepID=UPI004062AC61
MSENHPGFFEDPNEVRGHMAAEISKALLHEARAAMAMGSHVPQKRKRTKRGKAVASAAATSNRRKKRQKAERRALASEVQVNTVSEEVPQIEEEITASLETCLQQLRDTLDSVEVNVAAEKTAWAQRQLHADTRAKAARPALLDAKLSAERDFYQKCHRCGAGEAVIRCLDCVPLDMEYLCGGCDMEAHKKNVFHGREAIFHGYLESIPPTKAVVMGENGQPHFCEQVCQLPLPAHRALCECTHEIKVTSGKHISVVTMNGRYDVCLPCKVCPTCLVEWTPGVKELLRNEEPSLYKGLFLAKDEEVSAFLNNVRGSSMTRADNSGTCGVSRFRASKETSKKSSSKIDEEGIQVAVCRHGILLRGLNHYRGEVFAYPMFLQRELSERANVTFFCMDVVCRYWPYLSKVTEESSDLQPLMEMRPFLSVMHAKAHTAKCEVRWGGRNQDGAGNTVGEEVEQVNSFLSRAALVTKYMTKAGRENMLTQQAMGWNRKKTENLHKVLARRYIKISERAKLEAASFSDFCQKNDITEQTAQQWVGDVQQWAVTEPVSTTEQGATEDLRAEIESILVALLRKKHDLYRQNDSNQTRQRKRRKIRELKKKLKQKILLYNAIAEDTIDEELASNLTEDYILPWERREDGRSFRLKRSIFDQMMLVRRLEEEQSILVKEMSQHITSLRKEIKGVEKLKENIRMGYFGDMSEDAAAGWKSVLMRRSSALESLCQQAVSTYSAIVDDLQIQDTECRTDTDDEYDFSSPESEED